jgi:transcription elongation factor
LQSERAVPKLNELSIFAEGMAIGRQQLDFKGPDRDFLQWTYDNHIAACVKMGQKVEVKMGGGTMRGVIEDIFLREVTLRINNTEEVGVDVHCVRRFYEVGDAVKVIKASHLNREGWVVHISEGEITVYDRNVKEHVRFLGQT